MNMGEPPAALERAVAAIGRAWSHRPRVVLVLGSGLGTLAEDFDCDVRLPCREVPGFVAATAPGHAGRLACGHLFGVPSILLQGRSHLYEGYNAQEVVFPVRVMYALGAEIIVITNASGGLNPRFCSGDILVITDHINLLGRCSPQHITCVTHGRVVHGGASPYDERLVELACAAAREALVPAWPGCYVALTGPNYETRAEYRFLRRIGGDAVGMSTVPEALVAHSLGLRVLALSVITNLASPDSLSRVTDREVINLANDAVPRLRSVVRGVLRAVFPPIAP